MPWDRSRPRSDRYGWTHIQARAAAAKRHHPDNPCTRCGHPLGPMGPHLHYDHSDDGTRYLGFAHGRTPCPYCGRRCNVRAGAQAGRQRQQTTRLRW